MRCRRCPNEIAYDLGPITHGLCIACHMQAFNFTERPSRVNVSNASVDSESPHARQIRQLETGELVDVHMVTLSMDEDRESFVEQCRRAFAVAAMGEA